ncbi:glucose-6-phosphate dehydrogenase [Gorillibacterium sp. CAU 1737]|uniref:glucose-6-phosphate dehydrogenase n=1 Tax=Gorillibacterium sp. CAU 1737 TaxID=3140362 RepID=UPI00326003A2
MSEVKNETVRSDGAVFLLFGATGDLASRKLFPAIYSLYREGKLSDKFAVVGVARRPKTEREFRQDVFQSIREFARYKAEETDPDWIRFAEHFEYLSLDTTDTAGYSRLNELTQELEKKFDIAGNRLFYLALAPNLFGSVARNLQAGGLLDSPGYHRLIIEKPFGFDLPSATELNEEIRHVFHEEEIFRIDHYLGKEMVQNINVIRFANAMFEPMWNNKHIANIQITLSETVGVEDRGGYYDHSGALRDMGQNHMLQMVTMIAMEPPGRLLPEDIRDEKVKVLRALRGFGRNEEVAERVVRGQYGEGAMKGAVKKAYRTEDKVNPESTTETYFAAKLFVDNFRWAGVPFYVRTGKRLPAKTTEVVVEFKKIPDNVYLAKNQELKPNLLVFRVSPLEGIYLKINAMQPGSEGTVIPIAMDFCQSCQVGINTPEAYERLIYDAARGDSTHFTRWDEVALAWQFVDSIAAAWSQGQGELQPYAAGSWGPDAASKLLAEDGFHWWPVSGQEESDVIWVAASPT